MRMRGEEVRKQKASDQPQKTERDCMSQEMTTIVSCELCGQPLRIPAKRNVQVRCPTCHEVATHYQIDIDCRVIPFVCSETGQRFKVVFSRDSKEERYRIKDISQEDGLFHIKCDKWI